MKFDQLCKKVILIKDSCADKHLGSWQQQKEGMAPPLHERATPCKEVHRNPPVNPIHRSRQ